jgi:hypothetical protein
MGEKKSNKKTTHSSVVSMVLVARAANNFDMSLIRFRERLESRFVNNGREKMQQKDNSLQRRQRGVGVQGRLQR